ncbi:hypothetical protein DFH09DRAFT_1321815 [Mycena vulgaris]|nr:hypothetical protein DFH09DRAFT_1321815 [Mycena vulgaris]
MASAFDIRKRIDEVSLAIHRQKEVLRDLEQTKHDLQSDLNDILDPIARLPVEISSDIFMRYIDTPIPHLNRAPLLFLNVCRLWSKIAISTPSLWTSIHTEYPGDNFVKLMDVWLARAGNAPLSISLRGVPSPDLCDSMRRNAHRMQTLKLHLPSRDDLKEITTPFPSLQKLIISHSYDALESRSYSLDGRECLDMLRGAPDVVDCTIDIDDNFYWDSGGDEKPDVLTHSNLRSLSLEAKGALILRSLTLPALEDLTILDFYVPHDDFLAFLTRSSSPLKKLRLEITDWPGNTAETVFGLLPTLTDLYLTLSIPLAEFPLLEALGTRFPPQLIPNLRNLLITSDIPPTRAQYEQLISILSARRAPRQSLM